MAFLLAALLAGPAAAESWQSHDEIRSVVAEYLDARAGDGALRTQVDVSALDARLRLPACGEPIEAFLPSGGRTHGNVTVGVRCTGLQPWSIYVPARVAAYGKVLITKHPLARGAVLSADDVELAERDVTSQSGGYFADPAAVIGKAVKRPMVAGAVLGPNLIQEPLVVRRGERVTVLARSGGFEVKVEGEALQDGGRGDRVRVRNLASKRELQGTVTGPGTVEIRP